MGRRCHLTSPDRVPAGASKGRDMKRLVIPFLAAACAGAPLALIPTQPAQAQTVIKPTGDVALSIGRGQLITVSGAMADVFVANETVADVQVKSANQLYVFGKAGGETTVYASDARGTVIWSANVRVGSNIDSVGQMLQMAMPDAKVAVSTMGTNTVLLTGTVGAPEDAAEAQRLVQAFIGKDANVITRLKTATPLQVNLRVRFAEVSHSLVKTLGVNLTSFSKGGNGFQFGIGQGRTAFPNFAPGTPVGMGQSAKVMLPNGTTIDSTSVMPTATGTTLAAAGRFLGLDLLGALDAGETIGLVTTLSEPNLTAMSGETADFLAGGEYPIPISQGLGTTSVEYKKFGVSLAYTPTVLANGRISIRVRPEVSELSSQGSITLNGFQVPALTVRRAETTVELGSGQSFMIAGLMSNASQNTIKKMPGAGDLPILGALFRSTNFQRGDTELVIVITPYLVQPVDANDIKLPTDGFQTPNDVQRVIGNMENDGKSGAQRPRPQSAPTGTAAAAPQVGELNAAPAPLPAAKGARDKPGNRPANAASAAVPAPGFNLN